MATSDLDAQILDAAETRAEYKASINAVGNATALKAANDSVKSLEFIVEELEKQLAASKPPDTPTTTEKKRPWQGAKARRFSQAFKRSSSVTTNSDNNSQNEEIDPEDLGERLGSLQTQLEEANTKLGDARDNRVKVEKKIGDITASRRELDALYHSIFDGPTPSHPEEDEAEEVMKLAWGHYTDATKNVEIANKVVGLLSKARGPLQTAQKSAERAVWQFTQTGQGTVRSVRLVQPLLQTTQQAIIEGESMRESAAAMVSTITRHAQVRVPACDDLGGLMTARILNTRWISQQYCHEDFQGIGWARTHLDRVLQNETQRRAAWTQAASNARRHFDMCFDQLRNLREQIFDGVIQRCMTSELHEETASPTRAPPARPPPPPPTNSTTSTSTPTSTTTPTDLPDIPELAGLTIVPKRTASPLQYKEVIELHELSEENHVRIELP